MIGVHEQTATVESLEGLKPGTFNLPFITATQHAHNNTPNSRYVQFILFTTAAKPIAAESQANGLPFAPEAASDDGSISNGSFGGQDVVANYHKDPALLLFEDFVDDTSKWKESKGNAESDPPYWRSKEYALLPNTSATMDADEQFPDGAFANCGSLRTPREFEEAIFELGKRPPGGGRKETYSAVACCILVELAIKRSSKLVLLKTEYNSLHELCTANGSMFPKYNQFYYKKAEMESSADLVQMMFDFAVNSHGQSQFIVNGKRVIPSESHYGYALNIFRQGCPGQLNTLKKLIKVVTDYSTKAGDKLNASVFHFLDANKSVTLEAEQPEDQVEDVPALR